MAFDPLQVLHRTEGDSGGIGSVIEALEAGRDIARGSTQWRVLPAQPPRYAGWPGAEVPGTEVPARSFRFLRAGDVRGLEPLMLHSELDGARPAAPSSRLASLLDGHGSRSGRRLEA